MRQAVVHGRRRLNPKKGKVSRAEIDKRVKACQKKYPPAKVGLSILTFGAHGVTRKKRRNDCLAAARQGKGDPRSKSKGSKPKLLAEPYSLWAAKEPWTKRPQDKTGGAFRSIGLKGGGDTLRSMAKGWRPPGASHLRDLERKATIIGGLTTLQVLGIEPWVNINLKKIPALKLRNDRSAPSLLDAVSEGAKLEGKKAPKSIKEASELIRKRVIEEEAGGPAWYARALQLALAGTGAADKAAKVEDNVATGTGLAAKGLSAAAATATGTVIGAPVGAVLGAVSGVLHVVSLSMTAAAGVSKINRQRAEGEANGYAMKFQQSLENRDLRLQKELVAQQIEVAEAQRRLEEEQARIQGERISKIITAAVWVGVLGGTGVLVYSVAKAVKRRAA